MAWKRHDIERLFHSSESFISGGWGPRGVWPETYDELAQFLNDGWITVEFFPYAQTVPTQKPYLDVYAQLMGSIGSESQTHKLLKWAAWRWLRQEGDPSPQFEYSTIFGRADVAGVQIQAAAECGDTPPVKVAEALLHGWQRFSLWPFDQEVFLLFRLSAEGAVELPRLFEKRLFSENAAAQIGL